MRQARILAAGLFVFAAPAAAQDGLPRHWNHRTTEAHHRWGHAARLGRHQGGFRRHRPGLI